MGTKDEPVIIGVFEQAGDARRTIEDLRDANFSDRKIGVLTHDKDGDPEVKSFRSLEGITRVSALRSARPQAPAEGPYGRSASRRGSCRPSDLSSPADC